MTRPATPVALGGDGTPAVIAELGVNHDGSVATLLDLVRAAADAGAHAVKLQLFRAADLLAPDAAPADYQRRAGEPDARAMLARLELSLHDAARAIDLAHRLGVRAVATVFDLPLLPGAARLELDAFKTASPDLVHKPLLDALASDGRPMIVSTGAAGRDEVARALRWLRPAHGRLGLLQCVSAYPTPPEHAAVAAIGDLAAMFDGPVGYSDHTTQADTGALAVAHGARLLEKHLTLDRSARGPDHAASIEPADFARYVGLALEAAAGRWRPDPGDSRLGPPVKRLLAIEHEVRRLSRRSIVAARPLPAGTPIALADLAYTRPAGGLEPWRAGALVGLRLPCARAAGQRLPDDLLPPDGAP